MPFRRNPPTQRLISHAPELPVELPVYTAGGRTQLVYAREPLNEGRAGEVEMSVTSATGRDDIYDDGREADRALLRAATIDGGRPTHSIYSKQGNISNM